MKLQVELETAGRIYYTFNPHFMSLPIETWMTKRDFR